MYHEITSLLLNTYIIINLMHSLSIIQIIPKSEWEMESTVILKTLFLWIFFFFLEWTKQTYCTWENFVSSSLHRSVYFHIWITSYSCSNKKISLKKSVIENCIWNALKYCLFKTSVGIAQILKHIKTSHLKIKRHPKFILLVIFSSEIGSIVIS